MMFRSILLAGGLAVAASAQADNDKSARSCFADFTPMVGDVGAGTLPESAPYRLASPRLSQMTIVARDPSQAKRFDSGNYDMHTANETGPDAGRYLFTVFETGQAGIQRTDLRTMQTTTIWASPAPTPALNSHVAFDASRWTPWGSFLTAEESWSDPGQTPSIYGRLFEVTNPLAAPAEIRMVHRDIIPRVSHEGLAFDKDRNLYFIDERNGSHIFKYVPANPHASNGDQYFAAGQTFVLRVGDGTVKEATGDAVWVPLTNFNGAPLPGTVVVTDANGVRGLDGRATPKLAAFRGTAFDRPEDMEIKTLGKSGRQLLYVATTTNHKVFAIDLARNKVTLFASRDTIDLATGKPVGATFANPDNLAIDADGNLYIVEDQPGGVEDIWFTVDKDNDGIAEGVAKWASLSTVGAESTGLYFDRTRPDVAYVNVQHPDSGVDRTIMFLAPRKCRGMSDDDRDR
ncbi:alkaline phosphatase PhoX [Ideonella sp. A 288]|uniref:alkaline phosphatase PhoX n=1 Tax=Ideonella sp. A 288 TaxID=1962181 RepID=UPI0013036B2A|nr:alkaline phosphatase PhoX [Ideonella sp. A 288]